MSELRKRQDPGKVADTDPQNVLPRSTSVLSSVLSGFDRPRLVILIFLAAFAAWFLSPEEPSSLSHSYAVCSSSGARIYTVDHAVPNAQCLVVDGSLILDIGSLDDIMVRWVARGRLRSSLRIRYLDKSSIVVPGLSDSHAHILEYGASKQLLLESAKTIKDTVALVRQHILDNNDILNDPSKIIEGWGWDHTSWPVEEWPTSDDLDMDPIIRGRPVILQSKDGHALWLSKKTFALNSPWPSEIEGGVIMKDSSGNPSGVILDKAQDLLQKPDPTEQDLLRRFDATVKDVLSHGLTSVHDAGFKPISLEFFTRQAAAGNLPFRIYGMRYFNENDPYWGNLSEPIINAGDGRLNARSVKIFADGKTHIFGRVCVFLDVSQLHEPYHDNPHTKGFMRVDPKVLTDVVPKFLRDGWQVNIHAIGDYANGVVLDTFEAALKDVDVTALRPRLEHAQILTQSDLERVGKLGVISSIQPTHAISDMWFAEERLGSERVKGLYAFRSLLDHGSRLAIGSDFPVEDMNPLAGFHAAITRLSPEGQSPNGPSGWFPEQRLTRMEALRGMTIDAAYASFSEDSLGSLVPGKRADYVVLSQDIMTVPVDQILSTKVQATVIDGRVAFGQV
ncbi:amidohydrolase family-domain-containing protein [Suillus fuscotomentosus]|uniref:Amidohydrolase family-domain-containing protein n=1 Tax=Suillus fuscotomentosus TaxID=1912939 RepID=A0AAD4HGW4_9AGAM|nr:amidohydrolase family-domain-containing protein [Suillus fuscotomentosus]KAG1896052.1 amidohydrolase family-domain-containing protein [Suillus fuscotomentosus]